MTSKKQWIARFASRTDEQLRTTFDLIGSNPSDRVKSGPYKGCIKRSVANFGDRILDELKRRRLARGEQF